MLMHEVSAEEKAFGNLALSADCIDLAARIITELAAPAGLVALAARIH